MSDEGLRSLLTADGPKADAAPRARAALFSPEALQAVRSSTAANAVEHVSHGFLQPLRFGKMLRLLLCPLPCKRCLQSCGRGCNMPPGRTSATAG